MRNRGWWIVLVVAAVAVVMLFAMVRCDGNGRRGAGTAGGAPSAARTEAAGEAGAGGMTVGMPGAGAGRAVEQPTSEQPCRIGPPPSLRLVTASGIPLPDGPVEVRGDAGAVEGGPLVAAPAASESVAGAGSVTPAMLTAGVVVPRGGQLPIGPVRVGSRADPPTFAPAAAELTPGTVEVVVVPLGRLRLRCRDAEGHPVSRHRHALSVRQLAAADVARCSAGRIRTGESVFLALRGLPGEPLCDGAIVPVDGSVCVLADAPTVVRVEPAHGNWFGRRQRSATGIAGRAPMVGGIRAPVSAPVVGTPGSTIEVRIVLAQSGAIEVRCGGWPAGVTAVTLRRAGTAGVDGVGHSWNIAAERRLGARAGSGPPSTSRVDDRGGDLDGDRGGDGHGDLGGDLDGYPAGDPDGHPAGGPVGDPVGHPVGDPDGDPDGDPFERIDGLVPGRYRVDAICRSGLDVTCALVGVEVLAGRTSVVELAAGIGPGVLVLGKSAGRDRGELLLSMSPPAGWPLLPGAPPAAITVTLPIRAWREGRLRVRGLHQATGSALWFDGATMPRVEFDLARGSDWTLR